MQNHHQNWNWRYKKKLIGFAVKLTVGLLISLYLSLKAEHVTTYVYRIFQPFQVFRNMVFGYIGLSIGDIIYTGWGIGLVVLLVAIIVYIIKIQSHKHHLLYTVLKLLSSVAGIYLFFMIGWGGNYFKKPLAEEWKLDYSTWSDTTMVQFDRYLLTKVNAYAPYYHDYSFDKIRHKAKDLYITQTDCYRNGKGLNVKSSLFGNLLQYMGVQGYYNPFTGEAQVNSNEPAFMLPYTVCHELAHQSGVGAEDDANLLAYTVSMASGDSTFLYSAYFNLWLYTHMQVRMRDTVTANAIRKELNPITLAHIDTLKKLRKKYRSVLGRYTGDIYNEYLKLNHQHDGIESYDKVTVSAWAWEQANAASVNRKIHIP